MTIRCKVDELAEPDHSRTYQSRRRVLLLAAFLVTGATQLSTAFAAISFTDATAQSGITFIGRSFGASWGDLNSDGWPDLWTGNHRELASLYRNNKNGTFTNVIHSAWPDPSLPDGHGTAWADFDNDGDQDIFQLVGAESGLGSGAQLFLRNNNGTLVDQTASLGLLYPLGRGRTPLWLDWNSDGRLDVYLANLRRPDGQAPSELFLQSSGYFQAAQIPGLSGIYSNLFAQLSDLQGLGKRQLIIQNSAGYPAAIYTFGKNPATDQRAALNFPTTSLVRDVAIADFNGDLRPDFFLARMNPDASEAIQANATTIQAHFNVPQTERSIEFKTTGTLNFVIAPHWEITPSKIFIGATGYHPADINFSLSPAKASNKGIAVHKPGVSTGVYIGYNPTTHLWKVQVSTSNLFDINILITSTSTITNLVTVNFNTGILAQPDRLLINTTTGFIDRTSTAGLGAKTACQSVAAGDFDNDMDIDVYLVCRSQVKNLPNILYENLGGGIFRAVAGAGGAQGTTLGRGDSVAMADYNHDGFLDLLVTNGEGEEPFTNGPYQLFRNMGNSNKWIEIDLKGVKSNRDGVGAIVLATAGGVTQLREQNNGVHRIAQHHQRLHFGLGANTAVSRLVIKWPSGTVQELTNLPVNRIHTIVEPGGVSTPSPCGAPGFNPSTSRAAFIWRDCPGGSWHARFSAGSAYILYQGAVNSSQAFKSVQRYSIESNDIVNYTSNPKQIYYKLEIGSSSVDGFDFSYPAGSKVCFGVNLPSNATIMIGAGPTPISVPFDMETLGPCVN